MNNIDFAKQVSLSVYMQQTDTHRFNWCVVLELFVLPQYLRIKQLRFWLKKKIILILNSFFVFHGLYHTIIVIFPSSFH